jgi:tetratricopeptide (TPR) repeat protein
MKLPRLANGTPLLIALAVAFVGGAGEAAKTARRFNVNEGQKFAFAFYDIHKNRTENLIERSQEESEVNFAFGVSCQVLSVSSDGIATIAASYPYFRQEMKAHGLNVTFVVDTHYSVADANPDFTPEKIAAVAKEPGAPPNIEQLLHQLLQKMESYRTVLRTVIDTPFNIFVNSHGEVTKVSGLEVLADKYREICNTLNMTHQDKLELDALLVGVFGEDAARQILTWDIFVSIPPEAYDKGRTWQDQFDMFFGPWRQLTRREYRMEDIGASGFPTRVSFRQHYDNPKKTAELEMVWSKNVLIGSATIESDTGILSSLSYSGSLELQGYAVQPGARRKLCLRMTEAFERSVEKTDLARPIARPGQTTAEAFFSSASAKIANGDLEGAIADYSRSIQLDPKRAVIYNNRANAKQVKGDVDGALADYTRAIELDPKYVVAYYNRGGIQEAKGFLDKAIADYTRAIELDPKYAFAYNGRGKAKAAKSDLNGAIVDFSHAIELDPKNAEAYYNRGTARGAKGDRDGATADHNRAFELDPKLKDRLDSHDASVNTEQSSATNYYNRALEKKDGGDLDAAIANFSRAIELNPLYLEAYNDRAASEGLKGDLDAAMADYNRAIELDSRHFNSYMGRGVVKSMKGDLDGAMNDFNRAIKLNPKSAMAYYSRATIKRSKGANKEAEIDFNRAAELDPKFKNQR